MDKNLNFDEKIIKIVDSVILERQKKKKTTIKSNNIKELMYLIIKDVCRNENCDVDDIEVNNIGAYSTVITIKNKVIKFGEERGSKKFPNNPYIVKPLLRKEIELDDEKMIIEVTEKVRPLREDEEDYAKLFELYKKLRDIHLIWTDIAFRNVGVLLKDNVIHWNDNLNPSDKTLELDNYRGNEILKKGDWVVLDADFIFDEKDPNIIYTKLSNDIVKIFEHWYKYENKKEKINLSHHDELETRKVK